MSPWAFNETNRGKTYSRQLKLTFKRYEAGRCIDCPNSSPKLKDSYVRCARHRRIQNEKAKARNTRKKNGSVS